MRTMSLLIDVQGNMVVEPQFGWVYGFTNGISKVAKDKKGGYINRNGEYIWPPTN